MKRIHKLAFTVAALLTVTRFCWAASTEPSAAGLPQLGSAPLDEVVAAMTLEEKAALVVGCGLRIEATMMPMLNERLKRNIPTPGSLADKCPSPVLGSVGNTLAIPRLGISTLLVDDGPAGLRIASTRPNDPHKYYCTAFPVGTLLASTWDPELIYRTGQAFGNEVQEYGIDVLLAPGLNIQRNPLCGRNFEYYSEDPLLSGKIAAAMVRGVQSQGVGTSIKHFAANNQETNRNSLDTIVSQRALREIYLEGFRIAVEEGKPWTVMTSYNLINGAYTAERYDLVTQVLRDDWHFQGFVMSDWNSGRDPVAQMKAGNDLLMPGPWQSAVIMQAVKEGKLEESVLDQNVKRILQVVVQTPRFKKYAYSSEPDLKANAATARAAAADGIVLLKNEHSALPLSSGRKVAAFGNPSYVTLVGGSGSGFASRGYTISIVEGLRNAGYTLEEEVAQVYGTYIKEKTPPPKHQVDATMGRIPTAPEMTVDPALVTRAAAAADVALVTIGRMCGEGKDRIVNDDFNVSAGEIAALRNIVDAFHAQKKKVVVLLNIAGIVETASWRDLPDAILLTWLPGQEAGNAIADVLSGKVNPSGRLTATFPVSYDDIPSARFFPGEQVQTTPTSPIARRVVYGEGVYVGYRYFDTFNVKPAYEFGYGLSYTDFKFSDLTQSSSEFADGMNVTLRVQNTGSVAGKEVVQLYLSAPAHKLDKPAKELKGFAKTKLLQPGESQVLTFRIAARDLCSFDTATSGWLAEAGRYEVMFGASSRDIRLRGSFELKQERLLEKVSDVLKPQVQIDELKPLPRK